MSYKVPVHLYKKNFSLLFVAIGLVGCITTSPDALLSVTPADTAESAEPLGQPKKTGEFPTIGQVPTGQTKQITPTQRAIAKKELSRDVAPAQKQAAQTTRAQYLKEVEQLRKLAANREKQLQDEIEGDSDFN